MPGPIADWLLKNGKSTDYACGLAMAHRDGETVYGHTGGVSGFLSYNTFAPRTRSAVVLLVNGDDVVARPIHRQIMNLLTKDDEHVPRIDGPPPVNPKPPGAYRFRRGPAPASRRGARG